MTLRFSTQVHYGDQLIKVEADTFAEFHQAVARIQELSDDAAYLEKKTGYERIILRYYIDKEGNEYYGFQDPTTRRNVTFGQYREKQVIPFFPKGGEGYYDPTGAAPQTSEAPADEDRSAALNR